MSVTVEVNATKTIGSIPKYIYLTKQSVKIEPIKLIKHPIAIIVRKFEDLKKALNNNEPRIKLMNPSIMSIAY